MEIAEFEETAEIAGTAEIVEFAEFEETAEIVGTAEIVEIAESVDLDLCMLRHFHPLLEGAIEMNLQLIIAE